jgi:hypothetical protein
MKRDLAPAGHEQLTGEQALVTSVGEELVTPTGRTPITDFAHLGTLQSGLHAGVRVGLDSEGSIPDGLWHRHLAFRSHPCGNVPLDLVTLDGRNVA